MSQHRPTEGDGMIEPGIFTRLRPYAGWFFIATVVIGIAWTVLTWR